MLYCADVKFLCSPSWWNNNSVCRFRNIIYLFQHWFSFDFLSLFEAKVFYFIYICNVPCTKESEEVADKDINQDTYYTLDSGMKFIIWPWQHNLTSFTYNRGTTVWLPFLFCISPCFFIIRYFQICFYFSIIYHYYLLKVSNLFHVPCNHPFPNSRITRFHILAFSIMHHKTWTTISHLKLS